jgi:hypothetical protein
MKTCMVILLLSTVIIYGFSDENMSPKDAIRIVNLSIDRPLFNNNAEPLPIIFKF